ncbi:isochorismatase family protein [Paenirhodobacter populi]|uniref:isochorismatase family protein n=1 Tax=Paenirhodobacter populi TaxID=2306993 RepID=UPI001F4FC74F|nr:isochorismatase family protein [Sinirhodobacter populi]
MLDAVDLGFAVTVATDAVASSDPTAHEAVLNHMLPRLAQQVRLTTTAEIVTAATAIQPICAALPARSGRM